MRDCLPQFLVLVTVDFDRVACLVSNDILAHKNFNRLIFILSLLLLQEYCGIVVVEVIFKPDC